MKSLLLLVLLLVVLPRLLFPAQLFSPFAQEDLGSLCARNFPEIYAGELLFDNRSDRQILVYLSRGWLYGMFTKHIEAKITAQISVGNAGTM